jgi:hypothetical protein
VLFHLLYVPPFSGQPPLADDDQPARNSDESSSLLSIPGDIVEPETDAESHKSHITERSHLLDVTGLALLYKIEFWQLWILMGLLTGVGLMTIKLDYPPPSSDEY